jgi:hypothetical protein
MLDALNTLSLLADGEDPGLGKPTPGGTIVAFKEFEVCTCSYIIVPKCTGRIVTFYILII